MGLFDLFKKKTIQQQKPATLDEDIIKAKDWISKALKSSGYNADFTLDSLKEIDRFISDNMDDINHKPKSGGLLAEKTGMKIFALGSYVGEVFIAVCGGEWVTDDNDEQGEINIAVKLPSNSLVWPAQKVLKRVMNGPEDAIYPYAIAICKPQ